MGFEASHATPWFDVCKILMFRQNWELEADLDYFLGLFSFCCGVVLVIVVLEVTLKLGTIRSLQVFYRLLC